MTVIATYKPISKKQMSTRQGNVEGMVCEREYAFKVKGLRYFTTSDIRFPTTDSIPEFDLVLQAERCKILPGENK